MLLDRQVALVIRAGRVLRTVHVSTGKRGYATPVGRFQVTRKSRRSWSVPYRVWLPWATYFVRGIAFHQSQHVPVTPASHGCVRVTAADARWLYNLTPVGTKVRVIARSPAAPAGGLSRSGARGPAPARSVPFTLGAKDVAEARQRQGDVEAPVHELPERVRPDRIDDPAGLSVDPDLPLVDEHLVAAAHDRRDAPDVDQRAEPGLRIEVRRLDEVVGPFLQREPGDGVADGVVLPDVLDQGASGAPDRRSTSCSPPSG